VRAAQLLTRVDAELVAQRGANVVERRQRLAW